MHEDILDELAVPVLALAEHVGLREGQLVLLDESVLTLLLLLLLLQSLLLKLLLLLKKLHLLLPLLLLLKLYKEKLELVLFVSKLCKIMAVPI